MNNQDMKIAAVIVTYNRLELLKQCVASVRNQTRKPDEIIVVNNSSTDGTYEWLEEQSDVNTITQENSGSAGGQYTGIKHAYNNQHDWIWCMDDDCQPHSDALEILLSGASNSNCLAAAGKVVDEEGNTLIYHRGYFPNNRISSQILQTPVKNEPTDITEPENIQFASFVGILLNRNVVRDVGLPDRSFFIHHDDTEYCLRISRSGNIKYIPQSILIHKEINNSNLIPKKFLWKTSYRIGINNFWIKYYSIRNYVYLLKNYVSPYKIFLISLVLDYVRFIRRVLLYDDYKWIRIRIINRAFFHGLTGRLGKTDIRESLQKWIKSNER